MRYLLLIITVFFISCGNDAKKEPFSEENTITTHYYLIRHAEKDRTTNDDPSLTEIGKNRAEHWAAHFSDVNFDAVYSTNYNRTKQTAAPTAKKMNVDIQLYDPANLFDETFQKETTGKTVLVVGHSNTTPAFINTILGEQKYQQISDTENGMLFHVALQEDGTHQVSVTTVPFN